MAEETWVDRAYTQIADDGKTWVDRALDRAKDIPVIGRAAEWLADRRETGRHEEVFRNVVDVNISTFTRNVQLQVWRNALPRTEKDWAVHTEWQIQKMRDRPIDHGAWERVGEVVPLSKRRQASINAQERPRTLRGEIAYTLRSAAEARSWTKSSWATPESHGEIVAVAKREIARARELNGIGREGHGHPTMVDRFSEIARRYTELRPETTPPPPARIADSPDYVETRRFHDKHYKPVAIAPPEDRNQRSLGLDR